MKVRTTAEQEEAKRKEREKKVKQFNVATERAFEKVTRKLKRHNWDIYSFVFRVFTFSEHSTFALFHLKRKNREYDKEALEVTGELLGANPDFNTLWNFRREVLAFMKEQG